MAAAQKHGLSTPDKVRRTLAWTLFVLATPFVLFVAFVVFLQIFMLAINLFGSWISNHF